MSTRWEGGVLERVGGAGGVNGLKDMQPAGGGEGVTGRIVGGGSRRRNGI